MSTSMWLVSPRLLAVACLVMAAPTIHTPETAPPPTLPSPAARLAIAEFALSGEADRLYQREYARLEALCRGDDACRARHAREVRTLLAILRGGPGPAHPRVGTLHARLRYLPHEDLGFAIDVELASRPGRFVTWLPSVGDWGYGIHVSGVQVTDDWIRLVGPAFPLEAWTHVQAPTFPASVEPLAGALLDLRGVTALDGTGHRLPVPAGTYLIVHASADGIEFRAEIPSDMPCNGDTPEPAVLPPTWRTLPADLFDRGGAPRFHVAYPRGC